MVEGPKCRINARRLAPFAGSRLTRTMTQVNGEMITLDTSLDTTINRVLCVGKEIFLVMQHRALRIHYGMSGSQFMLEDELLLHCKDSSTFAEMCKRAVAKVINAGSRKVWTGVVASDKCVLFLFDSSLSYQTLARVDAVEAFEPLDVLSPRFAAASVTALLHASSLAVQDAVLDQQIMPGVGNIIKCEALFRCGICPTAVASSLPLHNIQSLVRALAAVSSEWYKACKEGKALRHQVYGRDSCGKKDCNTKISLVRFSDSSTGRITYFCPKCQSIGGAAAPPLPPPSASAVSDDVNVPATVLKAAKAVAAPVTAVLAEPAATPLPKPPCILSSQQQCKCGAPAQLLRTRKEGPTQNRLFWSCIKKMGRCSYFEWADSLFPRCEHGVPCTVRRVLKEGANNGRHFYTCCKGGTSQPACNFFQWVEDDHENRKRQVPALLNCPLLLLHLTLCSWRRPTRWQAASAAALVLPFLCDLAQ
jgi:formamidopyrimidine-DNA glycosylase